MRVDIHTLQRFYQSPLGAHALAMAQRRLSALWPHADGRDVLGVGYAGALLEPYRARARRCVALMPSAQGGERWPAEGRTCAAIGDELRLPFMDAVFDRVILLHALEETANTRAFMREIWRVTAPQGRIVAIAANRLGPWALGDATPFGFGRPFSRRQLAQLLSDAMFDPTASAHALFAPPWTSACAGSAGEILEKTGEILWPVFGGLVMTEAVKRLSAAPPAETAKVKVVRSAHATRDTLSHLQRSPPSASLDGQDAA
jgi:SAM-dependent methyltransferase